MAKFFLYLILTLLILILSGCAEEGEKGQLKDEKTRNESKNNIQNTTVNYDVTGTVQKISINEDTNKILLELSKKVQKNENQIWMMFGDPTKIVNSQGEKLNSDKFKSLLNEDIQLKANLRETCLDTKPRTCNAKKIEIE